MSDTAYAVGATTCDLGLVYKIHLVSAGVRLVNHMEIF